MPEPARNFQHYRVLPREDGSPWELGRGTMGITYKAFDVNLRCEVALKVVNSALLDSSDARARFVREARAAAGLRHRNVASVYHLGNDGEHFFYAMEFIDGETLEALVRRAGPLPPESVLRVVLQTARALAAAARRGIVHRDIKPANLMLARDEDSDEGQVVKVIDFGLARPVAHDPDGSTGSLTVSGFVGTPQYASPEQLEEQPLDARADIYSLGVTCWFLLAGRPPFVGSLASICDQQRQKAPPWEQMPTGLPPPLRELLARMLAKNPANRPQDAHELRREAETCLAALQGRAAPSPETAADDGTIVSAALLAPGRAANVRARQTGAGLVAGATLGGRYQLQVRAGEGRSGVVFRARDLNPGSDDRAVALKLLHAELTATATQRAQLEEDVRLIRAAPHPRLAEIYSLETLPADTRAVAGEWLNGYTLLDLLAARDGGLPAREALRLLQEAAAAADHARGRRLGRLGWSLHQTWLHFTDSRLLDDHPDDRAVLVQPLAGWPAWMLKIDPLHLHRNHAESSTWTGDVTLVPGGATVLDAAGDDGPDVVRPLSRLFYELLGGAPLPSMAALHGSGRGGRYVSLPALNEEANSVLRLALSPLGRGFETGRDLYEALAHAAGFEPDTLLPIIRKPKHAALPHPAAAAFEQPLAADLRPAPPRADFAAAPLAAAGSSSSVSGDITMLPPGRRTLAAARRRQPLWQTVAFVWAGLLAVGLLAVLLWPHRRAPRQTAGSARKISPTPAAAHVTTPAHPAASPAPVSASPAAVRLDAPPPEPPPLPAPIVARASPALARETPPPPQSTPPPLATPLPAPPGKLVRVRVVSKVEDRAVSGAEIFLAGKSLDRRTPADLELAPGDYDLASHYKDWPEVHTFVHVPADQREVTATIRLFPPSLAPFAAGPPRAAETRRTPKRPPLIAGPPPPAAPVESSRAAAPPGAVPVLRARPLLTPFNAPPTEESPTRRN